MAKISKWRWASVSPTLFGISCLSYTPLVLLLVHFRLWTFSLAVGIIIVSAILTKFGLTFKVLLRKFLHFLRGPKVNGRPWWYRKRFQDH